MTTQFVILVFGNKIDGRKRTKSGIVVNAAGNDEKEGMLENHTYFTLDEASARRDELLEAFPNTKYYIAVVID
jgi:hypothetical protein